MAAEAAAARGSDLCRSAGDNRTWEGPSAKWGHVWGLLVCRISRGTVVLYDSICKGVKFRKIMPLTCRRNDGALCVTMQRSLIWSLFSETTWSRALCVTVSVSIFFKNILKSIFYNTFTSKVFLYCWKYMGDYFIQEFQKYSRGRHMWFNQTRYSSWRN